MYSIWTDVGVTLDLGLPAVYIARCLLIQQYAGRGRGTVAGRLTM